MNHMPPVDARVTDKPEAGHRSTPQDPLWAITIGLAVLFGVYAAALGLG
jgi:hypothetical protein